MTNADNGKLGFWTVVAIAIGIGGMVGGGIFAVVGWAVQLARRWRSQIAGVVALTTYSFGTENSIRTGMTRMEILIRQMVFDRYLLHISGAAIAAILLACVCGMETRGGRLRQIQQQFGVGAAK